MSGRWILLRGLTRESGHWGDFPARLRERLGGAQVVALDLPGNGALNQLASPTRIEAITSHCRAQVRALGIAPPYHLLAMSMGAMVALDWAGRDPQAIAGCVLINTSLQRVDPWHRRLRPANYPALLRLALGRGDAADRERAVLRLTSRNPDAGAAVLDAWAALRRSRPVSGRNALRQLCAAARFRPGAHAPAVPLLVLASLRDALVDVRCSTGLAQRWHADIALHPDAGHDLPLDDAAWVAEQVARWLESVPRRVAD
ncbi:MAG: alpha/beta hydrolase [Pseudomonadota bacterium]